MNRNRNIHNRIMNLRLIGSHTPWLQEYLILIPKLTFLHLRHGPKWLFFLLGFWEISQLLEKFGSPLIDIKCSLQYCLKTDIKIIPIGFVFRKLWGRKKIFEKPEIFSLFLDFAFFQLKISSAWKII